MARFDIENFMHSDVNYCAPKARKILQYFLLIWQRTMHGDRSCRKIWAYRNVLVPFKIGCKLTINTREFGNYQLCNFENNPYIV